MLDCAEVPVFTTRKLNCDCCALSVPPLSSRTVNPPEVDVAAGVFVCVPVGVLVRVAVGPMGVFVRVAVGPRGVLVGGWKVGVTGVFVGSGVLVGCWLSDARWFLNPTPK